MIQRTELSNNRSVECIPYQGTIRQIHLITRIAEDMIRRLLGVSHIASEKKNRGTSATLYDICTVIHSAIDEIYRVSKPVNSAGQVFHKKNAPVYLPRYLATHFPSLADARRDQLLTAFYSDCVIQQKGFGILDDRTAVPLFTAWNFFEWLLEDEDETDKDWVPDDLRKKFERNHRNADLKKITKEEVIRKAQDEVNKRRENRMPFDDSRITDAQSSNPKGDPTDAVPGSPEKIAILRERCTRREPLWHSDDGQIASPEVVNRNNQIYLEKEETKRRRGQRRSDED